MITRAVRVGIPVTEAIRAVAREAPEPTAAEFRRIADRLAIGLPMDAGAERDRASQRRAGIPLLRHRPVLQSPHRRRPRRDAGEPRRRDPQARRAQGTRLCPGRRGPHQRRHPGRPALLHLRACWRSSIPPMSSVLFDDPGGQRILGAGAGADAGSGILMHAQHDPESRCHDAACCSAASPRALGRSACSLRAAAAVACGGSSGWRRGCSAVQRSAGVDQVTLTRSLRAAVLLRGLAADRPAADRAAACCPAGPWRTWSRP